MSKITFKEFLTEVDVGQLGQAKARAAEQSWAQQAAQPAQQPNQFTQATQSTFPNQGDIIRTKTGDHIFNGADRQNVYIAPEQGGKPQAFPQGSLAFKAIGQEGGKTGLK